MEEPKDEELVELAVRGDPDAYRTLVERHKDYVYTLIYRMVRHRETAQDLAQDVFIRLYRNLSGFRGEAKFTTWVYRIAVHLVTDYLRSQRKRTATALLNRMKDRFSNRGEEPEERLVAKERGEMLHTAMSRLPEKYRIVLYLYYYRQLSYQEIAQVTELPLKTIETRLYRGKSLLKKRWLEVHHDEE